MEQQAEYTTETKEALEMLGTGYENVRVKDESNDHKYFTITPRIVKAYARNSHDLALWETVKDIAGENGECFLNTDQLAILAGISTGQVSNSRKYWIKIGFLKGEIRKDPGYSQGVWHLSIPDLWAKNIEWCEKHLKIEDRIRFRLEHKSLHRVKASGSEGKASGSETKKMLIKKIQQEGEKTQSIFTLYEHEIGLLTPIIADAIEDAEKTFGAKWVSDAITESAKNNKRNWKYIEAILKRWKAQGNQEAMKPAYAPRPFQSAQLQGSHKL